MLNPDFNYIALIITTFTLFLITILSFWYSKKKDLEKLWK